MNILFLCYWGLDEGLTQATVLPHVKMLASFPEVKNVILCTIERNELKGTFSYEKTKHVPLLSIKYNSVLRTKFDDYKRFTEKLSTMVCFENINIIFCRSSLAGGIGHLVSHRTKVPYIVESFEPHAAYMLESGVWKKYDPRYWLENYFQSRQRANARYILPVANAYAQKLIDSGLKKEKVLVVPCIVDLEQFYRKPDPHIKSKLNFNKQTTIGIYVGKFGGLYFDKEAFDIFAEAKKVFADFLLIILTPEDRSDVSFKLKSVGFLEDEYLVLKVAHHEVPDYLSVADFAFATYKPSKSKRFLSPIKVGEYWACGLPVLLTVGIGDDSEIINQSNLGATFSEPRNNVHESLQKIKEQLKDEDVRIRNRALAEKYRNSEILRDAYKKILLSLKSE